MVERKDVVGCLEEVFKDELWDPRDSVQSAHSGHPRSEPSSVINDALPPARPDSSGSFGWKTLDESVLNSEFTRRTQKPGKNKFGVVD